jgi:hypothetical protein
MQLGAVDKNNWYTLHIHKCNWSSKNIPSVSFELNNLSEDTKYPVPNETTFIMSMEDAKELYVWLGTFVNNLPKQ